MNKERCATALSGVTRTHASNLANIFLCARDTYQLVFIEDDYFIKVVFEGRSRSGKASDATCILQALGWGTLRVRDNYWIYEQNKAILTPDNHCNRRSHI